MPDCETCPECEPRKHGHAEFRTFTGTEAAKISGATYQNWLIPWFQRIGNQQEERRFSGVWFDGIDPSIRKLYEAKGKYAFAFENSHGVEPIPRLWARRSLIPELEAAFSKQYYTLPPINRTSAYSGSYTWVLWLHMSRHINGFGNFAAAEHRPFPGWSPNN